MLIFRCFQFQGIKIREKTIKIKQLIHNPSFVFLWMSDFVSRLGDAITITIIFFVIGSTSTDPFLIGLVLFAEIAPSILFGVFAGALSDRFSKKWIMIFSDLFRLGIIILMIMFLNNPFILLLLVFAEGIGSATFFPARTSYITDIVEDKRIPDAMALSQSTYSILLILGPAITGILLMFFSSSHIIIIDAITFILSSAFIYLSSSLNNNRLKKKNRRKNLKPEAFYLSIKRGIVAVHKIQVLNTLLFYLAPVMLSVGVLNIVYNSLVLQTFHVQGLVYGIVEALFGFGAVVGSLLGSVLLKRINAGRLLIYNIIFLGIWMIMVYPLVSFYSVIGIAVVFVWVWVIGLVSALLNIPVTTIFLKVAPDKMRGRAVSFLQIVSNLGLVLGSVAGGYVSRLIGVSTTLSVAGILLIVTSLVVLHLKEYKPLISVKVADEEIKVRE